MKLLYALESIRTPALDAFMAAVTYIGSFWFFIAAFLVVFWCFSKKHGYYLMAVGLICTTVSQFMKILCQVPRPWVRDPNFTTVEAAMDDAGGYSFPSGHAQNIAGTLGGIARFTKNTALRVVCVILILLVAFSRMYLGVHYPADVAVGLVISLIAVFALYPVFEKSDENPRTAEIILIAAAIFSLAAALFVEFHAWPADVDAENLVEASKNLWTMCGCAFGAAIGAPIERRKVRFDVAAPWWAQILKVVLGAGIVFGLKAALKPVIAAVFGDLGVGTAIRYGLLVLVIIDVWPLTFPWFARGCRKSAPKAQ